MHMNRFGSLQRLGALVGDFHCLCHVDGVLELQFLDGQKPLLHGFTAKTAHEAVAKSVIEVSSEFAVDRQPAKLGHVVSQRLGR